MSVVLGLVCVLGLLLVVLNQLEQVVSESSALEYLAHIWEVAGAILGQVLRLGLPLAVGCLDQDCLEVEEAEVVPEVPLSPSRLHCHGSCCRRRRLCSEKSCRYRRKKSLVLPTVMLTNSVIL